MNQKGFSLIELLTTLSILAILTVFAWPGFTHLKERIEYDSTRNAWLTFLNSGRSSAISLQSTVIACPFNVTTHSCSDELHGDWLMFTDNNKNKHLDDGETSLQAMNVNNKTSFRFYPDDRRYIRFYDRPNGIYGGLMAGLTVCPHGSPDKTSVHIKVNIMGRVASSTSKDATNVIMRESGRDRYTIVCQ